MHPSTGPGPPKGLSFSPEHGWAAVKIKEHSESRDSSSPNTTWTLGEQSSNHVVLNMSFMSDRATKACVRVGRLIVLVSAALMIWEIVAKFTINKRYYLENNTLVVRNMCTASVCCTALLGAALAYAVRITSAVRAGKVWTPLQRRVVQFVGLQLGLQLANATFYLAPNALLLAQPCSWYLLPIDLFSFVRWTCWPALFLMLDVQAHAMLPARYVLRSRLFKAAKRVFAQRWPLPEGAELLMAYDLPIWTHIPLVLLLWLPTQITVILFLLWLIGALGCRQVCTTLSTPGCHPPNASPDVPCTQWGWTCEIESGAIYYSLTAVLGTMMLLMLAVYFVLMRIVRRELRALPYSRYREANLAVRFQMQVQFVLAALFTVAIIFNWYIKVDGCNGFIAAWFGMPSMQLMMSCIVVLNVVTTIPVSPSPRQLYLHQNLQRTLWRESSTLSPPTLPAPAVLHAGDLEAGKGLGEEDEDEATPMCCFETTLKALYWAKLAYLYKEHEDNHTCTMETALGLFDLKHHVLLWDRQRTDMKQRRTDTKCMIAWGEGTVVVVFRGTASLANVMADLRAWRTVHPPRRGSVLNPPMVHAGFWEAYTAEGHNVRILQQVRAIMGRAGSAPGRAGSVTEGGAEDCGPGDSGGGNSVPLRKWRVICIGHSLGGALATLAAYDVAKEAQRLRRRGWDVQVQLVTFGAPRPGNHAFAHDFLQTVPDSWDVVHSNDVVTKEAKFVFLFKRAANRVIVTSAGDILPRPSFLEASLHRGTSSVKAHFLTSYARSFSAVIRGQFKSKATDDSSRELLRELVACQYVKELLTGLLTFRQQTLWRLRYGVLPDLSAESDAVRSLPSFATDPSTLQPAVEEGEDSVNWEAASVGQLEEEQEEVADTGQRGGGEGRGGGGGA